MSNYYPVNKSYEDKKDCNHGGGHQHGDHHYDRYKPNKIISKCKNVQAITIPSTAPGASPIPAVLGSVAIRELYCFESPCVKIDTSSIIVATATGSTASADTTLVLNYQLSKRCDRDNSFRIVETISTPVISLGAPNVPETGGDGVGTPGIPSSVVIPTPSFCECEDLCTRDRCCVYQVSVTATINGDATVTLNSGAGVISATVSEENC